MIKIFAFLFPILAFGSWQAQTDDEALFLRRIADFWEEGEYLVAKAQIEEFLTVYPSSGFGDTLRAALGDLLLREKNYSEALNRYAKITTPEISTRSFLNRMQCLYHLGWYATLADECEKALKEETPATPQQTLQTTYFLAIALYQQCLNSSNNLESLPRLAERAQPYFETLFDTELSSEVAQAFAHLCCILKDYSKAARIVTDQAAKNPGNEEELLFQAALIQAEFDKELAIRTFSEIAKKGKEKAKDAAYNCLVLSFDAGHFDHLVAEKEEYLKQIPEERVALAHLFLGRSYLALKQYGEAVSELQTYLSASPPSSDFERGALLSLLEASFHSEDFVSFEQALEKFKNHFPSDPELIHTYLTRAQILKKIGQLDEARGALEWLLAEFPHLAEKPQIFFELLQLEYETKNWVSCYERSVEFLDSYGSKNDLSSYAWRYLISSLMEQGAKEPLLEQLKILVKNETLFNDKERRDWRFLLAKTYFELGQLPKCKEILEPLLGENERFSQEANGKLLMAFCFRDQDHNFPQFCLLAEEALEKGANLIEPAMLHAALFNAYLQQQQLEKAEEHLYQAFLGKATIDPQNLLWLADRLSDRFPEKAAAILDWCIELPDSPPLFSEPLIWKRAKIHQLLGQNNAAVASLEQLVKQYGNGDVPWQFQQETKLLLAENLLALDKKSEAIDFLDEILATTPTLRSETAASASLFRTRARVADWHERKAPNTDPEVQKAIVEFKNLILQRSLASEPIHLEAALDYISLQVEIEEPESKKSKKLSLLLKTKADFETTKDLLSKDYHESRGKLTLKNQIYEGYMRLIEAEILLLQAQLEPENDSQNKLQAKAKELLLQITGASIHPALVERARLDLEDIPNMTQKLVLGLSESFFESRSVYPCL